MTLPAKPPVRLRLVAAAALLLPGLLQAQTYTIRLVDGRALTARSRPLIALGKVSFLDESSRARTLPAHLVDVEATRAGLGGGGPVTRVWDARAMAEVKARVQIVGEAPPGGDDASSDPETAPDDAAGDPPETDRLRAEIARIDQQLAPLASKDRRRTVLMLRQAELRLQLARLAPEPGSG